MGTQRRGLEYRRIESPIEAASVEETVTTMVDVAFAFREASSLFRKRVAMGVIPEARLKTSGKVLSRVSLSGIAKS
ncbi:uncharacterized protein H6S33_005220, partial [Morchella sextelata]|uniref:uncharacterized protein n=1 Tax=Morchella sextelata TaxID=1174677 RepID=UPI001D047B5A